MTGTTLYPRTPDLQWRCLPFHALSADTLYRLLRLRSEVFVVEQNCVFLDMDGVDPQCLHVIGEVVDDNGTAHLHASTRLVPPGLAFAEASIGRVVTAPAARGGGIGQALTGLGHQPLEGRVAIAFAQAERAGDLDEEQAAGGSGGLSFYSLISTILFGSLRCLNRDRDLHFVADEGGGHAGRGAGDLDELGGERSLAPGLDQAGDLHGERRGAGDDAAVGGQTSLGLGPVSDTISRSFDHRDIVGPVAGRQSDGILA